MPRHLDVRMTHMMLESLSRRCHSFDSPQKASHPAGRRTCCRSVGPKPPHAQRTRMGPGLQWHVGSFSFSVLTVVAQFNNNTNKPLRTCVVVPDVDFPNFSQVVICFQVKLVQAATLEGSAPLQVAGPALVHTVQTDANVSRRACERARRVRPSLVPSALSFICRFFFFFSLHISDLLLASGQS